MTDTPPVDTWLAGGNETNFTTNHSLKRRISESSDEGQAGPSKRQQPNNQTTKWSQTFRNVTRREDQTDFPDLPFPTDRNPVIIQVNSPPSEQSTPPHIGNDDSNDSVANQSPGHSGQSVLYIDSHDGTPRREGPGPPDEPVPSNELPPQPPNDQHFFTCPKCKKSRPLFWFISKKNGGRVMDCAECRARISGLNIVKRDDGSPKRLSEKLKQWFDEWQVFVKRTHGDLFQCVFDDLRSNTERSIRDYFTSSNPAHTQENIAPVSVSRNAERSSHQEDEPVSIVAGTRPDEAQCIQCSKRQPAFYYWHTENSQDPQHYCIVCRAPDYVAAEINDMKSKNEFNGSIRDAIQSWYDGWEERIEKLGFEVSNGISRTLRSKALEELNAREIEAHVRQSPSLGNKIGPKSAARGVISHECSRSRLKCDKKSPCSHCKDRSLTRIPLTAPNKIICTTRKLEEGTTGSQPAASEPPCTATREEPPVRLSGPQTADQTLPGSASCRETTAATRSENSGTSDADGSITRSTGQASEHIEAPDDALDKWFKAFAQANKLIPSAEAEALMAMIKRDLEKVKGGAAMVRELNRQIEDMVKRNDEQVEEMTRKLNKQKQDTIRKTTQNMAELSQWLDHGR